jgi:hypothetical protein
LTMVGLGLSLSASMAALGIFESYQRIEVCSALV